MPELIATLDAFRQEPRRCGELDVGVNGRRLWMNCDGGAELARTLLDSQQHRRSRQ